MVWSHGSFCWFAFQMRCGGACRTSSGLLACRAFLVPPLLCLGTATVLIRLLVCLDCSPPVRSIFNLFSSFRSCIMKVLLPETGPFIGPQLTRVHSIGSFTSLSWQPFKATAYVSPTIKGSVSTAPSTPHSGLPRLSPTPYSKVAQSARR